MSCGFDGRSCIHKTENILYFNYLFFIFWGGCFTFILCVTFREGLYKKRVLNGTFGCENKVEKEAGRAA
jgi:hypothetical protein